MPELPELEIVSRLIGEAVGGVAVKSVQARAINTLKSFDPPVSELAGRRIWGLRRRGKHLIVDFDNRLCMLIHLMSAGRLQLFDKPASAKDKTARLLIDLADGRQIRVREFGTRQSSWVKVVAKDQLEAEETIATLGPDAWPDPPEFGNLLRHPRPLHTLLRDQRVIAGIGRSWIDEILHEAMLSPFKRGDDLSLEQADALRSATIEKLGAAISHYESLSLPLPDKFPAPFEVHRRNAEPCPRCGDELKAVQYEDHEMCYCPTCQTGGKLLKDRRLSRLLK